MKLGLAPAARLLDATALALALALLTALVHWWARPEILFLLLLGAVSLRLVVAPIVVPAFWLYPAVTSKSPHDIQLARISRSCAVIMQPALNAFTMLS